MLETTHGLGKWEAILKIHFYRLLSSCSMYDRYLKQNATVNLFLFIDNLIVVTSPCIRSRRQTAIGQ